MTLSKRDVKKLWLASGNQCAFPDCEQPLIDFDLDVVFGKMCHIYARKPGGARYDENMSEEEKESYENRILLCGNHHTLIDEAPDQYPPEALKQMKQRHEKQSPDARELSPELLNKLIDQISPSNLLVYVEKSDIQCLHEVLDWRPREKFPEKEQNGFYPIVFTLNDLKGLHGRLVAPYETQINGDPLYKQTQEWTVDELIHASSVVAKITQSAIQYYQVEGNRRKTELYGGI